MSITPPSPSAAPCTEHQNTEQSSQPGSGKAEDGVKQPRSRPSSPHLQLKSLLQSPGAKKRKVATLKHPSAPKEKKDSSDSDEEEGTTSEYQDKEATDLNHGM